MGVYHFYQFTGDDNKEAPRLLHQSCQMDERFGDAYVWWAYAMILALLFKEGYQESLRWLELERSIPNYPYWTNAHRVVALAYLGRVEEAKEVAKALQQDLPDFSFDFVRGKFFYLKKKEQIDLYLQGLSIGGVK